ncbi:MAG: hypothetical protein CXZ00_05900 [Acidobacteria bacterium]|nr:MAG: hypothetical protein CXZ00_05900 [Acidobacteriota bacterium]
MLSTTANLAGLKQIGFSGYERSVAQMIKAKNRSGMEIVATSDRSDLAPAGTARREDFKLFLFPSCFTRSCMGFDMSTAVSRCGMGSGIVDAMNRGRVYRERKMQEIRLRAYELFEQRGRIDGYDLDDWLQAEADFKASRMSLMSLQEQEKAA